MRCGIIFGVLLLVGCAASPKWYEEAGHQPTPDGWKGGGLLIVIVTDEYDSPLGSLKLRLTNEHLDIVEPDSWPVAWLIESSLPDIVPDAWVGREDLPSAYSISGDRLHVNLNATLVDDNIILRGRLTEDGAIGEIFWSSPFGYKVHGKFVAVKVRWL